MIYKKWEEWELQMIRDVYPEHGARPITEKTGREMKAVSQKAKIMGVRKRLAAGQKYEYDKWDDRIRDIYKNRSLRALASLAAESGIPVGSLKERARKNLKLPPMMAIDRFKSPWTEIENDILERYGEMSLRHIQKKLKIAGYSRSFRGIECQLTRLNVRNTRVEIINASEFARRMGYDDSVISRWIEKGWLIVEHHKMYVNPNKGDRKTHWITRKNAKKFILEHVSNYDHRRLDWIWVLDLLTEKAVGGAAVVDSCGTGYGDEYQIAA